MSTVEEVSTREVRDLLDELESGIEQLRVAYDKYFTGVDRIAPQKLHDKIQRLLRRCEATRPRQTGLRFRLNSLRARFVTYRHYWTRVTKQIENGTYRRHLQRAQRRQRAREPEPAPTGTVEAALSRGDDLDAMLDAAFDDGTQTLPPPPPDGTTPTPPPPGRRAVPPPPPPQVPGLEARKVRALYDELLAAKKAAGEDTNGLTYRGLCKQLARDAPKLRKRHGDVTFVVARDGGRVRLKAKVGSSG